GVVFFRKTSGILIINRLLIAVFVVDFAFLVFLDVFVIVDFFRFVLILIDVSAELFLVIFVHVFGDWLRRGNGSGLVFFVLEFIFVVVEPRAGAIRWRRVVFIFDVFAEFVLGSGAFFGCYIAIIVVIEVLHLAGGNRIKLFFSQGLVEQRRLRHLHTNFIVACGKDAQARATTYLSLSNGQLHAADAEAGLAMRALGEQGSHVTFTTCRRREWNEKCEW